MATSLGRPETGAGGPCNAPMETEATAEQAPVLPDSKTTSSGVALVPLNVHGFVMDVGLIGFFVIWEMFFKLPFCGMMYRCGCTFAWGSVSGGIARCNYRNPTGPNCPWCTCSDGLGGWLYCWTFGPVVSVVIMASSLAKVTGRPNVSESLWHLFQRVRFSAQAAAQNISWVSFDRPELPRATRACAGMALALCLWTVWSSFVGLCFYAGTDYPYWFFFDKS